MNRISTPRPFPDEYYEFTRNYLRGIIDRHVPGWLENPSGPLVSKLGQFDTYPSGYLICLAQVLTILDEKGLNEDRRVLIEKFIEILTSKNEKQFDETVAELKIGALLAKKYNGIMFEPLVDVLDDEATKPSSPDYQITVDGNEIFVEVTVFHMGQLDRWDRSMALFKKSLERKLTETMPLYREIEVEMPLRFDHTEISSRKISKFADRIVKHETGEVEIRLSKTDQKGTLRWKTPAIPILTDLPFNENPLKHIPDDQSVVIAGTKGVNAPFMISIKEKLVSTDASELLYKSLQNSLKNKKGQLNKFGEKKPYILAVELGHRKLFPEPVIALFLQRIWPNPKYIWLLGVLQFDIIFTYSGPEIKVKYLPNPNADSSVNKAIIDSFENP